MAVLTQKSTLCFSPSVKNRMTLQNAPCATPPFQLESVAQKNSVKVLLIDWSLLADHESCSVSPLPLVCSNRDTSERRPIRARLLYATVPQRQ